jgi:TetR/AcrR family acrAB operon transcriptional repressor
MMARSTKDDALETRERIIDAAEDVFHAQGVSRTSLADVAQAAGVTRGAIYWHFKNKTDLFNAMCERVHLPMEEVLHASLEVGVKDPLDAFFKGLTASLQQAAINPHWHKVLNILYNKCELVDPDDPILVRHRECHAEMSLKIQRIFSAAMVAGQLPSDFNVEMGHRFMHATITGMIREWILENDSNYDFASSVDRMVKACLFTLQHAPTLRGV